MFAKYDANEEAIRVSLDSEWGLRNSDGAQSRKTISQLLTAWDSAKEQVLKANQNRADSRAAGLPVEISQTEHETMKESVVKEFKKGKELPEAEIPCKGNIEEKLKMIDGGNLHAQKLNELMPYDEAEAVESNQVETRKGSILRIRRTVKIKGRMPRDNEELRSKHKLEGFAWLFARSKQPRSYLQDLGPETFVTFSDLILGEHVAGLTAQPAPHMKLNPSWDLVLSFEQ